MHKKRTEMPKAWPVARKSTKQRFIAAPRHAAGNSITVLVILRDILKMATTRKEVKFIMNGGNVKVNNKVRHDELFPVFAFDTISFDKLNKYYRLEIVNRKYHLTEINKNETSLKIVKISGKTNLPNNKIQMNLEDGSNMVTDMKFSVGDSAVFNTLTNKIEKILPLKEGANVKIILGKHAGNDGKIIAIEDMRRGRQYQIKFKDAEVFLPYKSFFVVN